MQPVPSHMIQCLQFQCYILCIDEGSIRLLLISQRSSFFPLVHDLLSEGDKWLLHNLVIDAESPLAKPDPYTSHMTCNVHTFTAVLHIHHCICPCVYVQVYVKNTHRLCNGLHMKTGGTVVQICN